MINVLKLPQYLMQLKFIQLTLIEKITSYFLFINLITANFQVFLVCGLTLWMNVYTLLVISVDIRFGWSNQGTLIIICDQVWSLAL